MTQLPGDTLKTLKYELCPTFFNSPACKKYSLCLPLEIRFREWPNQTGSYYL